MKKYTADSFKTTDGQDLVLTKENVANKSDSYTVSSSTTYASTKAVFDGLATKQNTLTNPVTGTGTTNYIAKFTGSGTIGNSQIIDNGTNVLIGTTTDNGVDKLQVNGSALIQGQRISSDYQSNLFIGTGAGENNTPLSLTEGAQNTFIGYQAGNKNTTGYARLDVGNAAGYENTTGNGNCNIGYQSGFSNIIGSFNTNLGTDAGARNRGNNNTFLGWHAGFGFSTFLTGDNNHLVGYESGINMLTAYSNNGHGSRVFYNLTDGFNNTAMGDLAGMSLTTGYNNSLFGRDAGFSLVSGNNNSIFGQRTGYYLTGELNTLIGGSAGFLLTNADLNVFLGGNSGTNVLQKVDAYNSIAIGFNTYTTKNFQAVIGNIDIGETILRGAVLVNTETDNGVDKLQVNGTISASPATLNNQVVVKSQLDGKADLDSPSLTGTPTAPTATAGTNTTQIATTAFVKENTDATAHWTKTGDDIRNSNIGTVDIGNSYSAGFSAKTTINGDGYNSAISTKGKINSNIGYGLSDQSSGMFQSSGIVFTSYLGTIKFNPIHTSETSGGTSNFVGFENQTIAPTSGSRISNMFNLSPIINQTGGANGITRGIYINPTLTSAFDFRAIEVTTGKVIVPVTTETAIQEYADNAAAVTAGLTIGTHYRTGDLLKIVH